MKSSNQFHRFPKVGNYTVSLKAFVDVGDKICDWQIDFGMRFWWLVPILTTYSGNTYTTRFKIDKNWSLLQIRLLLKYLWRFFWMRTKKKIIIEKTVESRLMSELDKMMDFLKKLNLNQSYFLDWYRIRILWR